MRISTASGPVDAVAVVPGSKSIANRALIIAALADGDSELHNVPDGDDTAALVEALAGLKVPVTVDDGVAVVAGNGGSFATADVDGPVRLDARLAGTTSRFLTALGALVPGGVLIDGDPPLRRRPMGPLHEALGQLGVAVDAPEGMGTLPAAITGPPSSGARISVPGNVSSQYLSALMMIGPLLDGGLRLDLTTPLVSVPYVRLTARVMADFGATDVALTEREIWVGPGRYTGRSYEIEPDASSASYPLALAAVCGGRVVVRDLRPDSVQGDAALVDLLIGMGCRPTPGDDLGIERDPQTPLTGIDADLGDVSDLVPTLAAVAATATSPSRFTGIGFIRAKESDRLGDLATELGALGAAVTVEDDGLLIEPAALHGDTVDPHHDHRLAMAFGVLGAVVPGVRVTDPDVVTKSWPGFWDERERIVATARRPSVVAAFDVDGTLTTGDCVVPFLRLVDGTGPLVAGVARRGLGALGALARRDRDALKGIATDAVFAGRPIAQVEGLGRTYAAQVAAARLRADTVERLREHLADGHAVVLVSASYGAYLRPLAERLAPGARPPIGVVATELVVDDDGRCTGELDGGNCRGPAKVQRLHAWLDEHVGGRDRVELWAYGDSDGDREMLADADHAVRVTAERS